MAPSSLPGPFFDVAVLGGGFSGTLTALRLVSGPAESEVPLPAPARGRPPRVALVESSGAFGPGVAYGRGAGEGLLNVPAGHMGAFPEATGDFLRWLRERDPEAAPSAFVPRRLYGEYLSEWLRRTREDRPDLLETIAGRALDVMPMPDGTFAVFLERGRFLYAGKIVLALGNFPPPPPVFGVASGEGHGGYEGDPRYLGQPWRPDTVAKLAEPGDVLILGSGLTCLDFLGALARRKERGVIHVLSRRGLFPLAHPPASQPPRPEEPVPPGTLREMLHAVRGRIADGAHWRDVIEALRPKTQALWRGLSPADRRRFLRHLRPYWESVRHRAPAEVLALKDRLEAEGRLVRHRGRLSFIEPTAAGLEVVFRRRETGEWVRLLVARVANGTGLAAGCRRTGEPLVRSLLDRGLARPDALDLGLETDAAGRLVPARGQPRRELFAIGSLRRGTLWETTAVRELRVQAAELAERIGGTAQEPLPHAGLPFEI